MYINDQIQQGRLQDIKFTNLYKRLFAVFLLDRDLDITKESSKLKYECFLMKPAKYWCYIKQNVDKLKHHVHQVFFIQICKSHWLNRTLESQKNQNFKKPRWFRTVLNNWTWGLSYCYSTYYV